MISCTDIKWRVLLHQEKISAYAYCLSRTASNKEILLNSDDDIDDRLNSSEGEVEYEQNPFQNNRRGNSDDDDDKQWNWKNCYSINERKFPFLGQTKNQKTIGNVIDSFFVYFDKVVVGKIVT